MLRPVAAVLCLLTLAGCSERGAAVDDEATFDGQTGRVTFEGTFAASYLADGQELTRSGGEHELVVPAAGWRNVNVALDIGIDASLYLVPPDCAGSDAPCAIKQPFEPGPTPGWVVPAMAAGTWSVVLKGDADGPGNHSSVYTITFDYTENQTE